MFDGIINWLYPNKCLLCFQVLPISCKDVVCLDCIKLLKYIESPTCSICGRHENKGNALCNDCKDDTFYFKQNFAAFLYDDTVKNIIHKLKYSNHPEYAAKLGILMANKFLGLSILSEIDYIMPAPMHKARKNKRGFDQSEILARQASKIFNIKLALNFAIRTKNTDKQSTLKPNERKDNVWQAFKVVNPNLTENKSFLIVDDIYTTGSTLNELSRTLIEAKAKNIYTMTLAVSIR